MLKRQLDFADRYASADKTVTARRKAGRRKHSLVAWSAGLEREKKKSERSSLRRNDVLRRNFADICNGLTKRNRPSGCAIAKLQIAEALKANQVEQFAEG